MRYLPLTLLLGVLLTLNLGCQKKGDPDSQPAPETKESSSAEATPAAEEHPAITAANKVLSAIHAGDDAAIRPLLNAGNQDIKDRDIRRFLEESKTEVGDVTEVTEIRAGRAENEVVAKIRVVDDEVFVIVLTLEDGEYLFEDINSPGVSNYESLKKLAP
jgi:predicted  nucleic acid-binding Zn-ribbon protein